MSQDSALGTKHSDGLTRAARAAPPPSLIHAEKTSSDAAQTAPSATPRQAALSIRLQCVDAALMEEVRGSAPNSAFESPEAPSNPADAAQAEAVSDSAPGSAFELAAAPRQPGRSAQTGTLSAR